MSAEDEPGPVTTQHKKNAEDGPVKLLNDAMPDGGTKPGNEAMPNRAAAQPATAQAGGPIVKPDNDAMPIRATTPVGTAQAGGPIKPDNDAMPIKTETLQNGLTTDDETDKPREDWFTSEGK